MLKFFSTSQYDNRKLYNNKNEYDLYKRLDRMQINYYTNDTNNINISQKNDKIEKNKNQQKENSKKKIEMKFPMESYLSKKFKNLERFGKTNKNSFTRSFLLPGKKDENLLKSKINISINKNNKNQNKDILSKSNNSINIKDFQYLENIIKKINKNKAIKIDVQNNNKVIESYNSLNINNRYKNNIPYSKLINLKNYSAMQYLNKLETEKETKNKQNMDNSDIIIRNNNNPEDRNKKILNFTKKLNTLNQSDFSSLNKPYSKKVIPKNDNKSNIFFHISNNKYNNRYINTNNYNTINNNNNNDQNDFNLGNSDINKNENNLLEEINNNSIEFENEILSNIKSKFERIKSNRKNKDIELNSSNHKYKGIPLLKSDIKKLSISVNKIKVNGVSNKQRLNKQLLFGTHNTPMKNDNNLKKALIKNIGVKRDNTSHSLLKRNDTPEKSIEKQSNNNINKYKENINNKDYSCMNFSSNYFLRKIGFDSKKRVIKIKNDTNNDNNNNDVIKIENKRECEVSFSSDDEEFNEIYKKNFKINNNNNNKIVNLIDEQNKKNKFKKLLDNIDINKSTTIEKNNPKIELIQINKKKSPTIVINNNINVNFPHRTIEIVKPITKFRKYKFK
jgi:hypothetical protein